MDPSFVRRSGREAKGNARWTGTTRTSTSRNADMTILQKNCSQASVSVRLNGSKNPHAGVNALQSCERAKLEEPRR